MHLTLTLIQQSPTHRIPLRRRPPPPKSIPYCLAKLLNNPQQVANQTEHERNTSTKQQWFTPS